MLHGNRQGPLPGPLGLQVPQARQEPACLDLQDPPGPRVLPVPPVLRVPQGLLGPRGALGPQDRPCRYGTCVSHPKVSTLWNA